MASASQLKPFFQSRWVCVRDGYFDVRTPILRCRPTRVLCPQCQKPAVRRDDNECTGMTMGPVPHSTKPRMEETPEVQFVVSEKSPVRQQGKRW